MSTETEKLNYEAGQTIAAQNYSKAIAAVLNGSGDLHLAALLAIARELDNVRYALILTIKSD